MPLFCVCGRPKMLPPATMARMKACQDAKAALEGRVASGELTVEAYVASLGALLARDAKLAKALQAMKREKEMQAVLRRYKAVKAEKAAVEADM